jgi:hypothetical protein
VVDFWVRDADQITNKWDGLIKDYKKLKEYIEGTSLANWWGMSKKGKKDLSKSRRMSLEFNKRWRVLWVSAKFLGVQWMWWIPIDCPSMFQGNLVAPHPPHVRLRLLGLAAPPQVPPRCPSLQERRCRETTCQGLRAANESSWSTGRKTGTCVMALLVLA